MQTTSKTLVVDDSLDFVEAVSLALGQCGFDVRTATSREDALEYAINEHFCVCVMDYKMPGMLPDEFVELMRSRNSGIVFILTSGAENIYEAASRLGISYVSPKTSGIELIKSVIDRIHCGKETAIQPYFRHEA